MRKENIFVFAVCGSDEHIETLNFSLGYLKQFCSTPIIVVTDRSRTPAPIEHDRVVDTTTPAAFDNHQASIFLKTNLHRILPIGPNYCYLDSDVVAVRPGIEQIFMYQSGPVTFASDHCKLNYFSPSAVHCSCSLAHNPEEARKLERLIQFHGKKSDRMADKEKALLAALKEYDETVLQLTPELMVKRDQLIELFRQAKRNPLLFPFVLLFKILPHFRRKLNSSVWTDREGNILIDQSRQGLTDYIQTKLGFKWDGPSDTWFDEKGDPIFADSTLQIEKSSSFRFDGTERIWKNAEGTPVFMYQCDHLREQIQAKFGIEVTQPNWQHWNGGVFLFNEDSLEFLDAWHKMTMEIFEDPQWKTRDQGTLIATVWKMQVQDQGTLPIEFNFLADYYNPKLRFDPERGFSLDNFKHAHRPYFAHIYHQWGNEEWSVWQWVKSLRKVERVA